MKFEEILETYRIQYASNAFLDFERLTLMTPPEWFEQEIQFSLSHRGEDDKEAFTSEFIIAPLLKEVWKRHLSLNLFSHVQISADGVTLVPDYLLSATPSTGYKALYKPLLLTVEAKDERFSEGWAQALFQAIICQKVNNTPNIPVYAIVTTGDFWQFGKLEDALFSRHPTPVALQPVNRLLGILHALFTACEESLRLNKA